MNKNFIGTCLDQRKLLIQITSIDININPDLMLIRKNSN